MNSISGQIFMIWNQAYLDNFHKVLFTSPHPQHLHRYLHFRYRKYHPTYYVLCWIQQNIILLCATYFIKFTFKSRSKSLFAKQLILLHLSNFIRLRWSYLCRTTNTNQIFALAIGESFLSEDPVWVTRSEHPNGRKRQSQEIRRAFNLKSGPGKSPEFSCLYI